MGDVIHTTGSLTLTMFTVELKDEPGVIHVERNLAAIDRLFERRQRPEHSEAGLQQEDTAR